MKALRAIVFILICFSAKANVGPMNILPSSNADTYKVVYASGENVPVKISIRDANNNVIFQESLKSSSFIRPYNFSQLAFGKYVVTIDNGTEKYSRTIVHEKKRSTLDINVVEVDNKCARYAVQIQSNTLSIGHVKIYDNVRGLVFEDIITIDKSYSQIYNLLMFKTKPSVFLMFDITFDYTFETKMF